MTNEQQKESILSQTQSALEQSEQRCEELRCQLGNTNRADTDYKKAFENEYANHANTTKALEQALKQLELICENLCGVKVQGEVTHDLVYCFVEGEIEKQYHLRTESELEMDKWKREAQQAQRERDEARNDALNANAEIKVLRTESALFNDLMTQRDELQAKLDEVGHAMLATEYFVAGESHPPNLVERAKHLVNERASLRAKLLASEAAFLEERERWDAIKKLVPKPPNGITWEHGVRILDAVQAACWPREALKDVK